MRSPDLNNHCALKVQQIFPGHLQKANIKAKDFIEDRKQKCNTLLGKSTFWLKKLIDISLGFWAKSEAAVGECQFSHAWMK